MNTNTFTKYFMNLLFFVMAAFCFVGIASAANVTVKADVCDSVGGSNTCNGNNTALKNKNIEYILYPPGGGQSSIFVKIDGGGGSNGQTSTNDTFATDDMVTVCEIAPVGFDVIPQPENSTGGSSQTADADCITAKLNSGNNNLQFAHVALGTTAATAAISGKVRDVNGKPATRVVVTLANIETGEVLATRTDLFGRYSFTDLPTGADYLVRVFSRRHIFSVNERFVNLLEDLTDVDFSNNTKGTKPNLGY